MREGGESAGGRVEFIHEFMQFSAGQLKSENKKEPEHMTKLSK